MNINKVHVFQSITNHAARDDYKRKLATMEVSGEGFSPYAQSLTV
jgi:hypothetical protein